MVASVAMYPDEALNPEGEPIGDGAGKSRVRRRKKAVTRASSSSSGTEPSSSPAAPKKKAAAKSKAARKKKAAVKKKAVPKKKAAVKKKAAPKKKAAVKKKAASAKSAAKKNPAAKKKPAAKKTPTAKKTSAKTKAAPKTKAAAKKPAGKKAPARAKAPSAPAAALDDDFGAGLVEAKRDGVIRGRDAAVALREREATGEDGPSVGGRTRRRRKTVRKQAREEKGDRAVDETAAPDRGAESAGGESKAPRRGRRRRRKALGRVSPEGAPAETSLPEVMPDESGSEAKGEGRKRKRRRSRGGKKTGEGEAAEKPAKVKGAKEKGDKEKSGKERREGDEKAAKKDRKKGKKDRKREKKDDGEHRRGRRRRGREREDHRTEEVGGDRVDDVSTEEDDAVEEAGADERAEPIEKVLLVNAVDAEEVRIALLENGQVEELYVEASEERSATGNVYRGRVQNVEKAIGAAFVDMGRGLTGFLHVSDLPNRPRKAAISDLVEAGQEVLVQVTRDSIGKKGPALTARISLPGRYLVLLTTSTRSGVSRRIGGGVRERARGFLEELVLPEGMGVIVRTAGEDCRLEDLQRDLDHLLEEWKRLEALFAQEGPPSLLRAESDVAERAIRDIMPVDTSRIIVDREDLAARIRTLLTTWYGPIPRKPLPEEVGDGDVEAPRPMPEVVVLDDAMPLLHAHGVEQQLEQAFRRTVRLPNGGSIVIDPTEALVAIDVNSGRFTDEEDPESTALGTNLEAVKEIARQLRLRDLGGLVVLDLIDMKSRRAARQVERDLKKAFSRDRARIRIGRIGPFGCLILSRQRVRQALSRVTHEECGACGGTGRRRHSAGLGLRVLREMQARTARAHGRGGLEVRVPRTVRDWILRHRASLLRNIEGTCSGPLRLEADDRLAADGWAMKGLPPAREEEDAEE